MGCMENTVCMIHLPVPGFYFFIDKRFAIEYNKSNLP